MCSWELNIPHKRRRGGRYEIQPGRGARTKWEKVGDGAEFFEEDEDEDENEGEDEAEDEYGHGDSSDEEDAPGRGEVPYEHRWEVDKEAISQQPVSRIGLLSCLDKSIHLVCADKDSPPRLPTANQLKRTPTG